MRVPLDARNLSTLSTGHQQQTSIYEFNKDLNASIKG